MLVCPKCGGKNIEIKAWVDANTNRFIVKTPEDDTWCDDCNDGNLKFINEEDFKKDE